MSVKPMKPENRINLIEELNERFEEVEGGGGGSTVTAGKGIAVSYGEVSVDKGDGLKFDENKLSVDRAALDIPEPVYAGIATALTASGNMNVLYDNETIKVNSKGQLYANVSGGGGSVAAGDGIAVADGVVSVNKGDGLKFNEGALEVDRDALNIPDAVTAGEGIAVNGSAVAVDKGDGLKFVDNRLEVDRDALDIPDAVTAGEGIAVNGSAVAVDKGDGLKFVDNRLEVDRDALNIPDAVTAGIATEVASTGAINVLYDDDTIKVNSSGKLYANVSGGGGGAIDSVTASAPLAAYTESGAVSLSMNADDSYLGTTSSGALTVYTEKLAEAIAGDGLDASTGKLVVTAGGDTSDCVKKPSAQNIGTDATVTCSLDGINVTAKIGSGVIVVSVAAPADTGIIPEGTTVTLSDVPDRSANRAIWRIYNAAFKVTDGAITFSDVTITEPTSYGKQIYEISNINACNGYNIVIPIYN